MSYHWILQRLLLIAAAVYVFSRSCNFVVAFATEGNLTHLAFGSCYKLKYAKSRYPNVFQSILNVTGTAGTTTSHPPLQAWLWTGDAIYPPSKGIAPIEEMEDEYRQMKAFPDYADFVKNVPFIYGTYDDHDFGGNDQGRHMPDKEERAKLFWDFVGLLPRRPENREGVYYSVDWGAAPHQVKIIFLDTRYFRDDHCMIPSIATKMPVLGAGFAALIRWIIAGLVPLSWCDNTYTERTILGEAQWEWLEQTLETSKATLHILVSSIQVLSTNPAMESWGQFPSEQRRLLSLLRPKLPGLVILSGDVHHGEILHASSGLIEVTSSGLTHDCSSPIYGFVCQPLLQSFSQNRQSPNAFYTGRNFGTMTLDWEQQKLQINVHALKNPTRTTTAANDGDNEIPSESDSSTKPVLSTGWIQFASPRNDHGDGADNESTNTSSPPSSIEFAPCMDGHLRPVIGAVLAILVGTTVIMATLLCSSPRRIQR